MRNRCNYLALRLSYSLTLKLWTLKKRISRQASWIGYTVLLQIWAHACQTQNHETLSSHNS